jgi:hypothetical protein
MSPFSVRTTDRKTSTIDCAAYQSTSEETKPLLPRRRSRLLLPSHSLLLLPPRTKASKSDNDHSKEKQNESHTKTPHRRAKLCPTPRAIVINVVAQNPEQAEVCRHHDQAKNPGHESCQHAKEGSDYGATDG